MLQPTTRVSTPDGQGIIMRTLLNGQLEVYLERAKVTSYYSYSECWEVRASRQGELFN